MSEVPNVHRHGGKARILVVSHEASRTGAPRVALDVVNSLPSERWERFVVLRWAGPLAPEFEATSDRLILEPLRRGRAALRWLRFTRPVASVVEQVAAMIVIAWVRPHVVWCNTVLSACYVRPATLLRRRVILHAHEPAERIDQVLRRYRLTGHWQRVILVGCAPLVCVGLAAATNQPVAAVTYLPSVPDRRRVVDLAGYDRPALPDHGVLVGACGTPNHTKGIDLWLTIVARVAREVRHLDPHFVWIGGEAPPGFAEWGAQHGLTDRVTFTGLLENPFPVLGALDVFTLTSRVDPFPLVVLEAMHLAVPVVAFAVGDVPEQIGDAGRLVPPLDCEQAADQIVAMLNDPDERRRLGMAGSTRAQQRFATEQFATEVTRLADTRLPTYRVPQR
jgi:glycosyltransferase involved in cell wall biosynthesis